MRQILIKSLLLMFCIRGIADARDSISINGRLSEAEIKSKLEQFTAIGCDYTTVVRFINNELKHEGGYIPSKGNGSSQYLAASGHAKNGEFEYDQIPDLSDRFSEPWIGDSLGLTILVSKYRGFPFKVWVISTWKLSKDGKLIEIVVSKQRDGI